MSRLSDYYRKQTTKSLKELAVGLKETTGGYHALQALLEILKERLGEQKLQDFLHEAGIE